MSRDWDNPHLPDPHRFRPYPDSAGKCSQCDGPCRAEIPRPTYCYVCQMPRRNQIHMPIGLEP